MCRDCWRRWGRLVVCKPGSQKRDPGHPDLWGFGRRTEDGPGLKPLLLGALFVGLKPHANPVVQVQVQVQVQTQTQIPFGNDNSKGRC